MITPDVAKSIDASVLCWLATVSLDGTPNVSPKEAFLHNDHGRILIAHVASPQSITNIEHHPQVCLSFIDVFTQRGYKVRGLATIVRPGEDAFSRHNSELAKMVGDDHEILAVIVVEPTATEPIVAPSYNIHPSTKEEDMIRQSLGTYRIEEYQRRVEQASECYAVIFTSQHSGEDKEAYYSMADRMVELASEQEGYLDVVSARDENGMGITVSYWKSLEAIRQWKQNSEHLEAQKLGRQKWYRNFSLRITKVIREYHQTEARQ